MAGSARSEWVRGRCLGRGSTATVYLAASTSGEQGNLFAVKSAEFSRSAPLRRERKILSSLCSPHVISYLGSDVSAEPDGRVLYNLFMEYVPGGSLDEAIKKHGGLAERTVRSYTRGILNGLAYIHSRGIVHCDVKGQNILVGEDGGGVKIADFGCARWVGGGDRGEVISGTPLYMAPEVARGEEQGAAADIWALGCTVLEMATGCPPWCDVADPVAAIHRIAFSGDVPEFPCNISDDARDFLGRCLNREQKKRWSAEELLNHPFVECCEEFADLDAKRTSPKSTLDQVFWDSWEDNDEDDDDEAGRHRGDHPLESAAERLRLLVGDGVSTPPGGDPTWEQSCWATIRTAAAGGSRGLVPPEDPDPSTSGSWSAAEAVSDGDSGEEGLAFSSGGRVASSLEGTSPSTLLSIVSTLTTMTPSNVHALYRRWVMETTIL